MVATPTDDNVADGNLDKYRVELIWRHCTSSMHQNDCDDTNIILVFFPSENNAHRLKVSVICYYQSSLEVTSALAEVNCTRTI